MMALLTKHCLISMDEEVRLLQLAGMTHAFACLLHLLEPEILDK